MLFSFCFFVLVYSSLVIYQLIIDFMLHSARHFILYCMNTLQTTVWIKTYNAATCNSWNKLSQAAQQSL